MRSGVTQLLGQFVVRSGTLHPSPVRGHGKKFQPMSIELAISYGDYRVGWLLDRHSAVLSLRPTAQKLWWRSVYRQFIRRRNYS